VEALRDAGCVVESLHRVGGGVPDLLVGRRVASGVKLWLLEVKDGRRPPSERRLSERQIEWHRRWWGAPIVVESVEDALRAVDLLP
jgi:hypothetical protein